MAKMAESVTRRCWPSTTSSGDDADPFFAMMIGPRKYVTVARFAGPFHGLVDVAEKLEGRLLLPGVWPLEDRHAKRVRTGEKLADSYGLGFEGKRHDAPPGPSGGLGKRHTDLKCKQELGATGYN